MNNLPPGVTQSMCEPRESYCGFCGHSSEYHYEEDDLVYNSKGEIEHACDHKNCHCIKFGDFEYESEWDEER